MILCMRKLLPELARCDVCKTVHIVIVLYDTVFVGQTLNVGYGTILWYPPLPNRMERYQLRLKCRHNLETPLGGRIQPGKRLSAVSRKSFHHRIPPFPCHLHKRPSYFHQHIATGNMIDYTLFTSFDILEEYLKDTMFTAKSFRKFYKCIMEKVYNCFY